MVQPAGEQEGAARLPGRDGKGKLAPPASEPELEPREAAGERDKAKADRGPDQKGRAARMAEQLGERRERHKRRARPYRVAATIAGFLIVLVGIVLAGPGVPGPGFLVILIGLAVLALEFDWAERLLRRGLDYADRAGERAARMSTRRKVVIAILVASAVAAAVGAAFVFDIPIPPWS